MARRRAPPDLAIAAALPGGARQTTGVFARVPAPQAPQTTRATHRHRAGGLVLDLAEAADGALVATLPAAAPGGWCRFRLTLPAACAESLAQITLSAAAEAGAVAPVALLSHHPGQRPRTVVVFVPAEATTLRLRRFGAADPDTVRPAEIRLICTRLSRPAAALALAGARWPRLAVTLARGLLRAPRAMPTRLRADLAAAAPVTRAQARADYALWLRSVEATPASAATRRDVPAPAGGTVSQRQPALPGIAVLVLHAGSAGAALAASLDAAAAALAGLPGGKSVGPITLGRGGPDLGHALAGTDADYFAVLQAGEILSPDALVRLAAQAAALGLPPILYADEDRLDPTRGRHDPLFKPMPSRSLMLSGALATGVWLVRRDALACGTGGPGNAGAPGSATTMPWAEAVRLDAWLRLHEAGAAGGTHRVPRVLTHRRADTETAPAAVLAAVAHAHCVRTGLPARIGPARPLDLRFSAPLKDRPLVSLIVPSACRAAHVAACLGAVLARTDYAALELVLVLTSAGAPDQRQQRLLDRLAADRRVRTVLVTAARFNFAAACNRAAAAARGSLFCLLNDDVAPRDPGWLAAMVGHLEDPAVGVVGARLLYPDRTVQHAGIVLCPDGSGTHWHRLLPAGAPGHDGRARLSQEYSAVTGACLLTRRSLWKRLGGLDESFATAFNDVDFCLRARAAGSAVVLAADAELIHGESRSFGRHYGPGETDRSRADRARLLARFPAAFQADPFHSPNLSPWGGTDRAMRVPPLAPAEPAP